MNNLLRKIKDILLSKYFWFFILFIYLGITCKFRPWLLLLNIICAIILIASFSLIFNRITFSIFFVTSIAGILQLMNFAKKKFFNNSLKLYDTLILKNLILGKINLQGVVWEYLNIYIIASIITYCIVCWAMWSYCKNDKLIIKTNFSTKKFFLLRACSIFIGIFVLFSIFITISNPKSKIVKLMHKHYIPIIDKFHPIIESVTLARAAFSMRIGPFAAIILGASEIDMKPINPSQSSELIKKQIKPNLIKSPKHLPNIIMVLHESTFNPKILDYNFAQNLNLNFFNKDQYTKFDGLFNVNTFGGYTFISEYEAHTGLSHEVFTGLSKMTFTFLSPITKISLFKELKKLGYKIIILYPTEKDFANADDGYPTLGANEIKDIHDCNYNGHWQMVKDSFIANMIIDTLENNQDQPVFIFAATLSNHGPHKNIQEDSVNCLNEIKDSTTCSKINDYILRLKNTEKDMSKLQNYLMNRNQKTMFINFGDHLPSFEGYIHQLNLKTDYYKTFYNVKTNFDIDLKEEYNILDVTFIPGLVLDIIGYNNNMFYQANSFMRKLCKGDLKRCSSEHTQFIESYKALTLEQFNILTNDISK